MKRKIFYSILILSYIVIVAILLFLSYLIFCPSKQKINCEDLSVQIIKDDGKQYILIKSASNEDLNPNLFPVELIDVGYLDSKLAITKYRSFNIFTLRNPIRSTFPIILIGRWVYALRRNIKEKASIDLTCWDGKEYKRIGSLQVKKNSKEIFFISNQPKINNATRAQTLGRNQ
jgi:hypothetical protein